MGALVLVAGHYEANADMMPTIQIVDVSPSAFNTSAVGDIDTTAAAPVSAPAAAPVSAASADGWEVAGDGLGVEGGRDLGRRMSIRLSQCGRPSTGGTPHRQFSKNS